MRHTYKTQKPAARVSRAAALALALLLGAVLPAALAAQQTTVDAVGVLTVPRGQSTLLVEDVGFARVSLGDPEIAEAVIVSPEELVLHGRKPGSTSLLVWTKAGERRLYTLEVTLDADDIQRQLGRLFPNQPVQVAAGEGTILLRGSVSDPGVARRMVEFLEAGGVTVVNSLTEPLDQQILLRVRFAEVSRTAIAEIGPHEIVADEPWDLDDPDLRLRTLSDGLLRLLLLDPDAHLSAFIQALEERGLFRSLAEPNLLVLEGEEASFLAGGEFPFPVVQGGGDLDAVTIEFKEFGVRLNFLPLITEAGTIRLNVRPEVSSLDFGTGLSISGFRIPVLRTRRAETAVELEPGQHLAIAGLIDNTLDETISKIPFLGDIPILGALFRNRDERQERTELLVIVTPELVGPSAAPPALPTGEPELWDWDRWLERSGQ